MCRYFHTTQAQNVPYISTVVWIILSIFRFASFAPLTSANGKYTKATSQVRNKRQSFASKVDPICHCVWIAQSMIYHSSNAITKICSNEHIRLSFFNVRAPSAGSFLIPITKQIMAAMSRTSANHCSKA